MPGFFYVGWLASPSSATEALFPLKTEELFAQRVFVFLLRGLHLAANVVFRKVRRLPFIDFGNRVVDRRKRLFLLDRRYPLLDRRMIGGLHLVEIQCVTFHSTAPQLAKSLFALAPVLRTGARR